MLVYIYTVILDYDYNTLCHYHMNLFRTNQRLLTLFSEAHLVRWWQEHLTSLPWMGMWKITRRHKNSRDVIRSSKITVISIWTKGNKMFLECWRLESVCFFLIFEGKNSRKNSKDKRKHEQKKIQSSLPCRGSFVCPAWQLPRRMGRWEGGGVGNEVFWF